MLRRRMTSGICVVLADQLAAKPDQGATEDAEIKLFSSYCLGRITA
jgi:hypothetical protein